MYYAPLLSEHKHNAPRQNRNIQIDAQGHGCLTYIQMLSAAFKDIIGTVANHWHKTLSYLSSSSQAASSSACTDFSA